ncbi:MAG: response regulator [Gammaproteobacteria bacterium]|nr:response regulator [Gammaproteobacteria bacterium]
MKKKSILVIDNNTSNAKLIKICLSNGGYDVLIADNAEAGLKIVNREHPSVILMDVKLSGMNGLQLSRFLKDNPETSHIVVLALTTHAWKHQEEKILNAGCDGFISQPFDTRTLSKVIDGYLQRHDFEKPNII